jgi:hypothetical protein
MYNPRMPVQYDPRNLPYRLPLIVMWLQPRDESLRSVVSPLSELRCRCLSSFLTGTTVIPSASAFTRLLSPLDVVRVAQSESWFVRVSAQKWSFKLIRIEGFWPIAMIAIMSMTMTPMVITLYFAVQSN